jgi:hypothetical protein
MAATRTALKQYFKKYATPTEEQFAALIDAFVHKDEDSLTQSKIDGLTAALESKVSSSDLASAVATAVEETLQNGNIETTPAAHQHAIADVEGLQAFVTKVNNFLESADVSDETINRWVEIESFLTGITDQETLAGLLLQLKNEILAQIPEPQTGNYLKQISDLDAYTDAQEGEIVQYVGSTTENYRRGFCYERVVEQERSFSTGIKIATFNNKAIVDDIVLDGIFYEDASLKENITSPYARYHKCKYQLQDNGDGTFTKISCSVDIYLYKNYYAEPLSYIKYGNEMILLPADLQFASLSYQNKLLTGGSYKDYFYVPSLGLWINAAETETGMSSGFYKVFVNPTTNDVFSYDPMGSQWNDGHMGLLITHDGRKVFIDDCEGIFSTLESDMTFGGSYWQPIVTSPSVS